MVCHGPVIPNHSPSEQHRAEFNLQGKRAGPHWPYHDMLGGMIPPARHHQRKRSTRLRPLSSLAEKLVGPGLQKRSRFLAKLIADWPVIAGDAAAFCLPVDVQFQNNKRVDGTLVLSVVSGRGPQLQMMSRDLIMQVNRSLGVCRGRPGQVASGSGASGCWPASIPATAKPATGSLEPASAGRRNQPYPEP